MYIHCKINQKIDKQKLNNYPKLHPVETYCCYFSISFGIILPDQWVCVYFL